MRRCAFLTLEDPTGFVIDDHLAYEPMNELGWEVEAVPWSRPGVAWESYDAVVIRSPWDYQHDPERFLAVLAEIEQSGAPLFNSLDIVRWNLRKTYLLELADAGVPIVPTVWRERLSPGELPDLFDELESGELVIKPIVGANADGAFRIDPRNVHRHVDAIETYYADRALMAQPFVRSVINEGEYSLFYFNGEHSHTILKTPKPADFRVQEEHGGIISSVRAGDELLHAGDCVLDAIGSTLLYARADFVRSDDGEFWLMELELIEPALYLRMDPHAPERFARAIHDVVSADTNAALAERT